MTVRLRPRQVLCSKCKDICNENSESITRKRKAVDADVPVVTPPVATPLVTPVITTSSPAKRSANAPVTRSSSSSHLQVLSQPQLQTQSHSKKQQGALSGIVNKLNIVNNKKALSLSNQSNQNAIAGNDVQDGDDKRLKRVILTRKKSVLIGEREKEVEAKSAELAQPATARTIKICYGPQREGTVLKIPAAIETSINVDSEDDDVPEENVVEEEIASKATRKALKKAKKAKKKITFQTIGSPGTLLNIIIN